MAVGYQSGKEGDILSEDEKCSLWGNNKEASTLLTELLKHKLHYFVVEG